MTHILIVEDDAVLSNAYKLILEREDFTVVTAANGQEALDATAQVEPDIILLDLMMPVMDGLTFLETFDTTKHPKTTVVILSNVGDEEKVEQAVKLGAYKYIVKAHASPQELSMLVKHLISKNLHPAKT